MAAIITDKRKTSDREGMYQSVFVTHQLEELRGLLEDKSFFDLCNYYMGLDILGTAVRKMASYVTTSINYSSPNEGLTNLYKTILDDGVKVVNELKSIGEEALGYGNSIISVYIPFKRHLHCRNCGERIKMGKFLATNKKKKPIVKKDHIKGFCHHCKEDNVHIKVKDVNIRDYKKIKIIRWKLKQVDLEHMDLTGRTIYSYKLDSQTSNKIKGLDVNYWSDYPLAVLQLGMEEEKVVNLSEDRVYHMKGFSLPNLNSAYGLPIILPAVLLAMHVQQLRKINDVVAQEHCNLHKVFFPMPQAGQDPIKMVNQASVKQYIDDMLKKQREDPASANYIPIPLGYINTSGEGRSNLVYPEIKQTIEEEAAAIGVPLEFIFGGLSYAGTSVSLRMLENYLLEIQNQLIEVLNWVKDQVRDAYDLPDCGKLELNKFKMADDIQMYQIFRDMVMSEQMSLETFYERTGLGDYHREIERVKKEVMEKNSIQKSRALMDMKLQSEMNKRMMADEMAMTGQQPGQQQQQGPTEEELWQIAQEIAQMPPQEQEQALQQLEQQLPGISETLIPMIQEVAQGGGPGGQISEAELQELARQLLQLPPQQIDQELAAIEKQNPEIIEPLIQIMEQMQQEGATMDPQIQEILNELSQMSPEEQEQALQEISQQDPQLAQELEQILMQEQQSQGQEPQGQPGPSDAEVEQMAEELLNTPPEEQEQILQQIGQEDPELAEELAQIVQEIQGQEPAPEEAGSVGLEELYDMADQLLKLTPQQRISELANIQQTQPHIIPPLVGIMEERPTSQESPQVQPGPEQMVPQEQTMSPEEEQMIQQQMAEQQGEDQQGITEEEVAELIDRVMQLPPEEQESVIGEIAQQDPELAQIIAEEVQTAQQEQQPIQQPVQQQPVQQPDQQPAGQELQPNDILMMAQRLMQMPDGQRDQILAQMQTENPALAEHLTQLLNQSQNTFGDRGQQGGENVVDMRPLPQQRSPRRTNSPI